MVHIRNIGMGLGAKLPCAIMLSGACTGVQATFVLEGRKRRLVGWGTAALEGRCGAALRRAKPRRAHAVRP